MLEDREQHENDDDSAWVIAQRRADVLRRLLTASDAGARSKLIALAASQLAISRATVYRLLARFRTAEVTSALLPSRRGRPAGARSLDQMREAIIAREISRFYLKPERPRLSHLIDRIGSRCHQEGLPTPDWRTVRARVRSLDVDLVARRRQDRAALARTRAVPGEYTTSRPLEVVQIDHTQVDVITADATSRQAMTRPWLTVAIDVHTRMVMGTYLSLNDPSVVSVGVCLLNAVFEKSEYLASRDLDLAWPAIGLPTTIHVDNGPDFRSRAFLRGCQEHGIHVAWRPPATPRYGGHIERLMGTQMSALHVLAGSTGSSVADRQDRDAQSRATLTMRELERWLLLEILGKYHQKIHATLHRPPIAVWRELMGSIPLRLPPDRLRFWVGFLPEKSRLLRRDGVHLFGIRYWSPALSQDVGRFPHKLAVRYDPRDLSHVFVRRPNGHFVEARYRDLAHPAISLWERDAAVHRLNETGRREVDENTIFAAVSEQRAIEDDARLQSARARRDRERRPTNPAEGPAQAEVRLQDIDTGAPVHGERERGSVWDES
jgi:putative transposase